MHATSPVEDRTHRIKKTFTIIGLIIFILSLAFPAYLIKVSVTNPINTIVKTNVTENHSQTAHVITPSLVTYSQLQTSYPETIQCSCTQTKISYSSFVGISHRLHEICSSELISQEWISYLSSNQFPVLSNDFRVISPMLFEALRSLCEFSQQTVHHNIMQFLSNEYVSTSVTPANLLNVQIQTRLEQLRSTMSESFSLTFSMIRETIQANALFSGLGTNFQLSVENNNVSTVPFLYNGCNCALSSKCITPAAIYNSINSEILFIVPGFYKGCYVMESLLQSDLRCFYNQTCLDKLSSYYSLPTKFHLLNKTNLNMFSINSTIADLLRRLMIEEQETILSYKDYYHQCSPSACTYSFQEPYMYEKVEIVRAEIHLVHLIGTVIGIIGGTIAILHILMSTLIKLMI
ncbi:unnamed protein product [Adineta ricciae]|uniref:Uncharacterized protein n=1 Tax=Adineta ricciae TaxID=249248 RepID=A0A815PW71_ADIRI|nr:unnamed protein product [Adineta ricciae]CAF1453906.1 unnamed protein product [Adineta ricciae]